MNIHSAARKVRDRSADTVRRLQLHCGLARLDRTSTARLSATLEWFARSRGAALECGTGLATLALAAAASAGGGDSGHVADDASAQRRRYAAGAHATSDRAPDSRSRGKPSGAAARIGVIALVPDRWRGIWTTRHQVLSRLSLFFQVVWVDEARWWNVFWAPGSDRHEDQATQSIAPPPGCVVYDPGRWLPQVYRPYWLRDWIQRRRVRNALRILRKKGCRQIILSIWRPQFAWALDVVDADLTCYHIDDEYSFAPVDQPNDAAEVALIGRVDQVFVHSKGLLAKKGGINPNTLYMPNGVDHRTFSTPATEPADLAPIPRPRMGYVGVLKQQLDMSLLLELARGHPEWSFVGVGPVGSLGGSADLFARLAQLPNVHLLGNRALETLPAYVQHMDVCLMPYLVNGYTKFINPIKMYEYLATGRPIVSTPIESVIPFSDVVQIARTVEEWETVLLATVAAQGRDGSACAVRSARATEYDWNLISERVAGQLRLRLDELPAATS